MIPLGFINALVGLLPRAASTAQAAKRTYPRLGFHKLKVSARTQKRVRRTLLHFAAFVFLLDLLATLFPTLAHLWQAFSRPALAWASMSATAFEYFHELDPHAT